MDTALVVGDDIKTAELRRRARRGRDGRVFAQLLAIASVLGGMSRAVTTRAAGTA